VGVVTGGDRDEIQVVAVDEGVRRGMSRLEAELAPGALRREPRGRGNRDELEAGLSQPRDQGPRGKGACADHAHAGA
jgi:hypothetical protein